MGRRWVKEKKREYYYRKAKAEAYRSRAAYKLLQLNRKFGLIREGNRVLDLGAAPGGWMQVAGEAVGPKGLVVGVDLQGMEPFPGENMIALRGDFTTQGTLEEIRRCMPQADVVISDASPDISGVWEIDHVRSIELCRTALTVARGILKPGGNFLAKVFQGAEVEAFLKEVKAAFQYVKMTKPQASRSQSAEMYIVAKGKRP
ncbi:MAG: RlmE family RNA methyltransferase [Euryarchaeota archaeon]|nr:RlmE family RNA methyltransferase [Euryarchaeota archaeon]